jgi:hypothetical protein
MKLKLFVEAAGTTVALSSSLSTAPLAGPVTLLAHLPPGLQGDSAAPSSIPVTPSDFPDALSAAGVAGASAVAALTHTLLTARPDIVHRTASLGVAAARTVVPTSSVGGKGSAPGADAGCVAVELRVNIRGDGDDEEADGAPPSAPTLVVRVSVDAATGAVELALVDAGRDSNAQWAPAVRALLQQEAARLTLRARERTAALLPALLPAQAGPLSPAALLLLRAVQAPSLTAAALETRLSALVASAPDGLAQGLGEDVLALVSGSAASSAEEGGGIGALLDSRGSVFGAPLGLDRDPVMHAAVASGAASRARILAAFWSPAATEPGKVVETAAAAALAAYQPAALLAALSARAPAYGATQPSSSPLLLPFFREAVRTAQALSGPRFSEACDMLSGPVAPARAESLLKLASESAGYAHRLDRVGRGEATERTALALVAHAVVLAEGALGAVDAAARETFVRLRTAAAHPVPRGVASDSLQVAAAPRLLITPHTLHFSLLRGGGTGAGASAATATLVPAPEGDALRLVRPCSFLRLPLAATGGRPVSAAGVAADADFPFAPQLWLHAGALRGAPSPVAPHRSPLRLEQVALVAAPLAVSTTLSLRDARTTGTSIATAGTTYTFPDVRLLVSPPTATTQTQTTPTPEAAPVPIAAALVARINARLDKEGSLEGLRIKVPGAAQAPALAQAATSASARGTSGGMAAAAAGVAPSAAAAVVVVAEIPADLAEALARGLGAEVVAEAAAPASASPAVGPAATRLAAAAAFLRAVSAEAHTAAAAVVLLVPPPASATAAPGATQGIGSGSSSSSLLSSATRGGGSSPLWNPLLPASRAGGAAVLLLTGAAASSLRRACAAASNNAAAALTVPSLAPSSSSSFRPSMHGSGGARTLTAASALSQPLVRVGWGGVGAGGGSGGHPVLAVLAAVRISAGASVWDGAAAAAAEAADVEGSGSGGTAAAAKRAKRAPEAPQPATTATASSAALVVLRRLAGAVVVG